MLFLSSLVIAALAGRGLAHADDEQKPVAGPHKSLWYNTLPGDGGTQVSGWSGRICGEMELLIMTAVVTGRLGVLWDLDFWSIALFPVFGE